MQGNTIASNRKSILFLLFTGYLLANVDRFLINYAILPISKDLQLSASSTGIILSAFFAGYAIMQMPGGWLADKFGGRFVVILSLTAWSLFTGLTAAAWSFVALIVIRFLFGIGEGAIIPASAKLITQSYPQEKRSRAMSVLLTSAATAGIVTPILATSLMVTTGWRMLFVYVAIVGVIIAILDWFYLKPKLIVQNQSEVQAIATKPPIQKGSFKTLFKSPMMWSIMVTSFAVFAINWGTSSWIPTYLVQERGLDLVSLGMLQLIPAVTSIIFLLVGGYIVDKMKNGNEKWLGVACAIGLTIVVYLMFAAKTTTGFVVYQSIMPLFTTTIIILVNTIPMKRLPVEVGGSAVGMANFGGQLAGFVAPMAIGFTVDALDGSYSGAIWMLVGFGVACFVALLTLSFKNEANQTNSTITDDPVVNV